MSNEQNKPWTETVQYTGTSVQTPDSIITMQDIRMTKRTMLN